MLDGYINNNLIRNILMVINLKWKKIPNRYFFVMNWYTKSQDDSRIVFN